MACWVMVRHRRWSRACASPRVVCVRKAHSQLLCQQCQGNNATCLCGRCPASPQPSYLESSRPPLPRRTPNAPRPHSPPSQAGPGRQTQQGLAPASPAAESFAWGRPRQCQRPPASPGPAPPLSPPPAWSSREPARKHRQYEMSGVLDINDRKTNDPIKMGRRVLIDVSLKKMHHQPIGT